MPAKPNLPKPFQIPAGVAVADLKPPCPFTGKPVEVRRVGGGRYMAIGPFWTSKLYDELQPLMHDLFSRRGVEPAFPRYPERIQTRDLVPVDDGKRHVADHVAKEAAVQHAVDNFVDNNAQRLGLKR